LPFRPPRIPPRAPSDCSLRRHSKMSAVAYLRRRGAAPASGSLFESMALEGSSAVQAKRFAPGRPSAKVLRVQQKPTDEEATHSSTSLSSTLTTHGLPRQNSGSDASSGRSSGVSSGGGQPRGELLLKNPPSQSLFSALGLDGSAGIGSGCTRAPRRHRLADRRAKPLAPVATALTANSALGGKDLDALSTAIPTQESLPDVADLRSPPSGRRSGSGGGH